MLVNSNKTEPDTLIVDESFNPENIGHYNLFINGGDTDITIGIVDMERNKFIALQVYSFNQLIEPDNFSSRLLSLFKEDSLLADSSFNKVSFCFTGNKSTLVPDPLFLEDQIERYLSFHYTVASHERILVDQLPVLGAKNIFAIPSGLEKLILDKFPQSKIHHHATSFIESVLMNNKNKDEKIITIQVRMSGFEMTVTKRNDLLFYNSFRYVTTEDFLYYLLFTMEQLEMNPESTPLVFTGAAERNSAIYISTCKYIRDVSFGERTHHCDFSYAFEKIPAHFHYNLFSQYLCG